MKQRELQGRRPPTQAEDALNIPAQTEEAQMTSAPLQEMIRLAELYLHKGYLQQLSGARLRPLPGKLGKIEPGSNLRLIQVDAVLYGRNERLSQKLRDLLGAVDAYDAGLMVVVNGKRDRAELYIGVCAPALETVNPAFHTFLSSLSGILPGCRYRQLKTGQTRELLKDILPCLGSTAGWERHAVASVSAFPLAARDGRGKPHEAAARLDVLLDGMRGNPFTMVLLNQAVDDEELSTVQRQLEALYGQLSPYEHMQASWSESDMDSVNLQFSHAVNANESYSTGLTHGVSHTHGTGKSETRSRPDRGGAETQASLGLLGAAVAAAVDTASAASKGVLQSLFFASSMTSVLTNAGVVSGLVSRPSDASESTSEHEDHSVSESRQITFSTSGGTSDSSGYSIGNNRTSGSSMQYTWTNKFVSGLLEELDRELQQVRALRQRGALACAAYFIAGEEETAVTAANLYRAMTQSGGNSRMQSPINRWSAPEQLSVLTEYLCRGRHPEFVLDGDYAPVAGAAQFISVDDVPAYVPLPEHSVPGVIVSEHAAFPRDVIAQRASGVDQGAAAIGHIYHMGRVETQTPVCLTMNDLTKHLFVAGATGVGKSNFCYQLLDQLLDKGVRALVIEPAKGEYASVFGGREDFSVFGADPQRSPVLRINPFAFPQGVSVVQHVERLLDIFNAAWPMYSAMPAILKDAMEKIYRDRGFESVSGVRPQGAQFPCFDDLLNALPQIIAESAYSAEVKGNYTGALVTRVKSLTNGIYGIMFGRDEIGDETLFDGNVVVDISRVGSMETKALIMGVLTMRLSEYRMCSGRVNSPLRHVTLLEEAHNLLRGQTPGLPEGTNLRAASVEMITNAIAEMRTYGEGFLIADQSPSVLDQSVIRNTQTKVAFMLPDRNDREIMGGSMSLDEGQKQEMARLSPGVAAVYQNGWTNAVLCKINLFSPEKACPFVYDGAAREDSLRQLRGQCLSVILSGHIRGGLSSISKEKIAQLIREDPSAYGGWAIAAADVLRRYLETGSGPDKRDEMALIDKLIPLQTVIRQAGTALGSQGVRLWEQQVEKRLKGYADLTEDEMYALISCGIHNYYPAPPEKRQSFRMLYLTYCAPDRKDGPEQQSETT